MSAIVATLTSLPYTQYRRNKHFYLWYDGFYFVLFSLVLAAMLTTGWQGLTTEWDWRLLLLLPLATHVIILCNVWVHNATHNNFPRSVNRLIGEICGVVVLTRFASWEILHQRHHKFSDDPVDDPHPLTPETRGYWPYLVRSVVGIEEQLQRMYFEMFGGETDENKRYQIYRAVLSFSTSFILLPVCWYFFLGGPAFVMLMVPASLIGFFQLIHFNWSTHNPWSPTNDFRPVNLDHGFYWVGNRLWHGIYFHGNHHKNAGLFNPSQMADEKALPVIKPGDTTDHYPRKKTKKRKLKQAA